MEYESKITKIEAYVYQLFNEDSTGHDFYHMRRVAKMAKKLAKEEGGNVFISEAGGWLHDIGDKKLFLNPELAVREMYAFLQSIGLSDDDLQAIHYAMKDVSFSKGHEMPKTLEGQIVQDADRLDAIGAVGIARTFAFGGAKNRPIHTEDKEKLAEATIQHFYDKLLHLKDLLNTNTAKVIANERHRFMETYLEQFYHEWEVE